MHLDLFWLHYIYFGENAGDVGFSMFSPAHLILLSSMIALIVFISYVYAKGSEKTRDNTRKALTLFVILSEFLKQCVLGLFKAPVGSYMPLEFCSIAMYIMMIDSMWPGHDFPRQIMLYAGIPSGLMAMCFPTVLMYPPVHFITIRYYLLHACIPAYGIMLYAANEVKITYKGVWKTLAFCFGLAMILWQVDINFDRNHMFLTDHVNNIVLKKIWDLSGGSGGITYILGLTIFVGIVMHVFYLLFRGINARLKR